MTLDAQAIIPLCPELDAMVIEHHLARLDDVYMNRFDAPAAAAHLSALSKLTKDNPVDVRICRNKQGTITCQVVAIDHPFEFSLITGVLASMGFETRSGDVFTLRPSQSATSPASPLSDQKQHGKSRRSRSAAMRSRRQAAVADPMNRPVIIDVFRGRIDDGVDFASWTLQCTQRLRDVIGKLESRDPDAINEAQRKVNQLVTQWLRTIKSDLPHANEMLLLDIEPNVNGRTRLNIVSHDTPAFLYSLATSLALNGLSVQRVRIGGEGHHVADEIDVVDAQGQPITDPDQLTRISWSIKLTKQFTYYLGDASAPFTALTRFEQLTERIVAAPTGGEAWLNMLSEPRTMQDLAKLLGASDYLWEDFIRRRYETLLPAFAMNRLGEGYCQPPETIPLRLQEALGSTEILAEQRDRLNKFKDNEIFELDLDHILNPAVDFREFSTRLTLLAETLVATATQLVYDDMVASFGTPKTPEGDDAGLAVFGLGKLGGVALGYASDIELLYVYTTGKGMTTGGKREPITNREFFLTLAKEASQFIKTKREGIFEVDLRLRPYGSESPLASSLHQFSKYYAPGGEAHAFERLALVRMRWIGGDAALGYTVEKLRHKYVYQGPELDMDELWDIFAKQHKQKSDGQRKNAKYSSGALVDLEGTVQMLQVMHAKNKPQLRTPRLSGAIEGLRRARVLTPKEYGDLLGAYRFLRRLINALRMLRGNAQDLFLPAQDANEYTHLARRMGYNNLGENTPAIQLAREFDARTAAVRAFIEHHFNRPCPGDLP